MVSINNASTSRDSFDVVGTWESVFERYFHRFGKNDKNNSLIGISERDSCHHFEFFEVPKLAVSSDLFDLCILK